MPLSLEGATLAVIIGTLAAIVYSLRVLVLLERRIARMDYHLELMTSKIAKAEMSELKLLKRKRRWNVKKDKLFINNTKKNKKSI